MSLNIKILGTGCSKCIALEKLLGEVIKENDFEADVSKVQDIIEIINYGVMGTPGLVVNEKVVVSGRVPSKDEIKKFIEKQING